MNINIAHGMPSKLRFLLGSLCLLANATVFAQLVSESNEYANPSFSDVLPLRSAAELESLVGPVALYPDDLLAVVLPAATYPLEIVQAARFLELFEQDSTLTEDDSWDDSVVALLNYPEVLQMMNDDIDWTWKLGEAVVAQQSSVVAAIESFRDRAHAAGNLQSDEHQTVTRVDDAIEIQPADKEVIYVPYYEPERVVVYSPYPVYHYYPRAYPLYYYPYADNYHFGSGFFWGVSTAFSIGWSSDYLHVYHHSYRGHPYYGHSYRGHRYRHASVFVHNYHYVNNHRRKSHDSHHSGDYWRPRHSGGARPGKHVARDEYYRESRHLNHGLKPDRAKGHAISKRKKATSLAFRERGGSTSGVATSPAQRRATKALHHSTDPTISRRGHSNDVQLRSRETRVSTQTTSLTKRAPRQTASLQHKAPETSNRRVVSLDRKSSVVNPPAKSKASKPARQNTDKPAVKIASRDRAAVSRPSHKSRSSAGRQERRQRR